MPPINARIRTAPEPVRGRPCLLTPERRIRLLNGIREGLPLKQSAMLAGISYESLNRWRIAGEAEDARPEFRHFCQSLRQAQAVAMQRLVGRIQTASRDDWKAAAWLLERRHAEEFCRPQRLEHSGPGGMPITTVSMGAEEARNFLTDDSLKSLVRSFINEPETRPPP